VTERELPVDLVREFVIAGHGNLERVQEMLAGEPALLNAGYAWRENDTETAIQAASHVGNAAIAEYLLDRGSPLAIYTAAMLGRTRDVEALLAGDAALINATGAHGIALLTHAAMSGDVDLVRMLAQRGARDGMSQALSGAVNRGYVEMVRWLLQNGQPDLSWKNFQGMTASDIAAERRNAEIIALLQQHSAE
jgi:uncharacterized protein